ncbi:penicillin acylase family protein [Streptomyces sp. NPDC059474]|uniref:penicillin acylase family protein n=1 Tax=Streptomyces sp. NPDC059474 TaxID=3346846 RepID=UPI003690F545
MEDSTPLRIPGLAQPVTIRTDCWGVPHIEASSADDAFLAQGWVAARDRLFQLDWWRRRGLGRTAEVLGAHYVERDRAARLFLYRGDIDDEWAAYGPRARSAVTRFVAGVNAWIAATERYPGLLPPEFIELGYRPALWEPEDVVRLRSHGLYGNLEQEVARAVTLREFGAEVEDLRRRREPAVSLSVPEGLDLAAVDPHVLDTYRLAMGPVATHPAPTRTLEGSNNWVVAGGRTKSGRPLLANDPHRAMSLPSLRYLVHLICPEFDVIGAGEPALPGISIGHNGSVAFGLTIWAVDQEDLYVYELHPDDDLRYRYGDGWESMEVVHERIPLPDGDREVELRFTRHGPVIHSDAARGVAHAVRAAWLEPGTAPYLASLNYLDAGDGAAFVSSLDPWRAPGVNHVFADADGRIGWCPRALVPVRPNWDGLLPVPGDGRYEWAGFREARELPTVVDPAKGWVATANEMNLPEDGSWDPVPVSYEWYPPFRAQRLHEVLGADTHGDVAGSIALQNDDLSIVARSVCSLLPAGGEDDGPDVSTGLVLLHDWDCRMSVGSAAAALFETWLRGPLRERLYRDALRPLVPHDQLEVALAWVVPDDSLSGDMTVQTELLNTCEDQTRVLVETLGIAVRRCRERLGDDPATWSWGRLNTSLLRHPLSQHADESLPWLRIGPRPKAGGPETVGVAVQDPATGVQTTGASVRFVVDVGNWDASVAINTPGQSGDPRSSHYDDLYDLWLAGEVFPLFSSPEAVRAHTESTEILHP